MAHLGNRQYVRKHWKQFTRKAVRGLASWSVMVITIIGSFIAFLPDDHAENLRGAIYYVWTHPEWLIMLVVLAIACALIYYWPRMYASYKDKNTDIRVTIECCDILEQRGMKVIHVVDTFDSELDTIITPRSLHGAFIRLCQQQQVDLDAIIDAHLMKLTPVSSDDALPGRKNRYELGSLCPITIGDKHYCWAAFTHLQPNGTIKITKDEYVGCLKNMWRNLAAPTIREEVVNVAVMGNRFVDLPAEFSTEQKIDLMIQTFYAVAREKACCRTLRICIHPDNVTDIDFGSYPVVMAHLAKRPVV